MQTSIILMIVTMVVVPAVFLAWLWWGRERCGVAVWVKSTMVGLFAGFIVIVGQWSWFSHYLRWILLFVTALAIARALVRSRQLPRLPQHGPREWSPVASNSIVALAFGAMLIPAIAGRFHDGRAEEYEFPLSEGLYCIAHGGSSKMVNYHVVSRAQQFACDVVRLGPYGARAVGLYPKDLTDYAIFGDSVFSPCAGSVLVAVDGLPDRIPPDTDRENPAGNHVVIRHDDVDVFLAHLMQGSVSVQSGVTVAQGAYLGRVGNSGNTSEPHLHIHASRDSEGDVTRGHGVPMRFDGRFLTRNSLVDKRS